MKAQTPENTGENNGKETTQAHEADEAQAGLLTMPLTKGAKPGSKGFQNNIRKEVAAGKPVKQAVAIAYSVGRKSKSPKKR